MVSFVQLAPRATESNAGSHQNAGPNSVSGMLSTLIPSFLVACVLLGFFLILRPRVQRIYMPRTFLGTLDSHQKTPKTSLTLFGWIPDFLKTDNAYVLNHHSLDGYLFLRFWKCVTIVTGIGWPITWIILMPVYGTAHGGQQQFDKISFSNLDTAIDSNRLYAVSLVAWIVFGAIMYLIGREIIWSLKLKQAYLRLPGIASRISSRTVLISDIPSNPSPSESSLRRLFPAVKTIWLQKNTEQLDDLVKERDKAATKLEGAIVKMSKTANDRRRKADKKGDKEAQEDILHWLDENKRPTHRLKPLIGKKVDTVNWGQEQLKELVPRVERMQKDEREKTSGVITAAFLEFEDCATAEAVFHRTDFGGIKNYTTRAVGIGPQEIIWKNLKMSKTMRTLRSTAVIAIICVMIIFWGPFTAFVGALSNINSLISIAPFLSFINNIPSVILGVVTGLLPSLLLAILMVLVPIIMRLLFKFAGAATVSEVELKTQTWYFVFQVIQVFLVTTLASGAVASVAQIIAQPGSATTLLANNLPKASNFYINYFVLYGLAIAAQSLFNIVAVLLYMILGKFLDKTPRKMYSRFCSIAGLKWGSLYPKFTNLAVIAITYSCISPLVKAIATIGFIFLGFAFRYSLLYSVDVTAFNTQGQAYAKALQQLTTGVYLAEVCLIGLMGIGSGSSISAVGPLVLMIILLVATAVFHIMLNRAFASIATDVADDFNEKSYPTETKNQMAVSENPKHLSTITKKAGNKNAEFFVRILRLPPLPQFESFLQEPVSDYSEEDHVEAYMNPSLASPSPVLWIVRDDIGVSAREKAAASEIVEVTDECAWWDKKSGKLTTGWSEHSEQEKLDNENAVRTAPIYEKQVHY